MKLYHGTSSEVIVGEMILPPSITNNLREDWRTHHLDKVFSTDSLKSAKMYAKKACNKYGGNPIVYIVKPIGYVLHTINHEYMSDKAIILGLI